METQQRLQLACSSKSGVTCLWGPPSVSKHEVCSSCLPQATFFDYTPDGTKIAFKTSLSPYTLSILNTESGEIQSQYQTEADIKNISISPRGSYLVTEEKKLTNESKNLKIWSIPTGELLQAWSWSGESWPPIQWSEDESICGRLTSTCVLFYHGNRFDEVSVKLSVERVKAFTIAPGSGMPYKVAVFVPEIRDTPAFVGVYRFPVFDQPVASKNVKAQTVDMKWNSTGTALVLQTMNEEDRSRKSYYGETGLHYFQADGKMDCTVNLKKEGPIHMVRWSPVGQHFAVVYGDMPAKTSIFDTQCNPKIHLPAASRNKILWSPCGRLLLVGGFASLSGEVDIWDWAFPRRVGHFKAFCSSHQEWSPDSQYILTSILFSRMKVDNGIQIFNYRGDLVYKEEMPELYKVGWRPGKFDPLPIKFQPLPENAGAGEITPVSAGTYIHPKARGNISVVGAAPPKKSSGPRQKTVGRTPKCPPSQSHQGLKKADSENSQSLSKNARRNRARRAKRRAAKSDGEILLNDNSEKTDEENTNLIY